MKRFFLLLFIITLFNVGRGQGFRITLQSNLKVDTVAIKAYNAEKGEFYTLHQYPYQTKTILNDEQPLLPGIYLIQADSLALFEIMISDENNQQFSIDYRDSLIIFKNSKENEANQALLQERKQFEKQLQQLDIEFAQIQQQQMPQYMLQPMVDSIIIRAERIMDQEDAMINSYIKEYEGMLFASIVSSSKEVARPPKEIYADKRKYITYFCNHLYDSFAWEDNRLLTTPIPANKHTAFVQTLFQLSSQEGVPIVVKALNDSKVNEEMYYHFFDFLTKQFGSFTSKYHDETIYIAMLKDLLTYPNLSEERKVKATYQLSILDINHPGSPAPDFPLVMSTGDTSSLYDIEADFLIMYFQNPDCPTCGEIMKRMEEIQQFKNGIESGRLKLLTIYFEDDEPLWRNYLSTRANPEYLHGWNYNFSIESNKLYNTYLIPMLMLVDKDKKIIKKDLLPNEIEGWLKHVGL